MLVTNASALILKTFFLKKTEGVIGHLSMCMCTLWVLLFVWSGVLCWLVEFVEWANVRTSISLSNWHVWAVHRGREVISHGQFHQCVCVCVCVCVCASVQCWPFLFFLSKIYYSVYQSIENLLYFIKSKFDLCMSPRLLRENMYRTNTYMNY